MPKIAVGRDTFAGQQFVALERDIFPPYYVINIVDCGACALFFASSQISATGENNEHLTLFF